MGRVSVAVALLGVLLACKQSNDHSSAGSSSASTVVAAAPSAWVKLDGDRFEALGPAAWTRKDKDDGSIWYMSTDGVTVYQVHYRKPPVRATTRAAQQKVVDDLAREMVKQDETGQPPPSSSPISVVGHPATEYATTKKTDKGDPLHMLGRWIFVDDRIYLLSIAAAGPGQFNETDKQRFFDSFKLVKH